jgi:hypothetical protein
MEGNMNTDRETRTRIAAMTAAEAAIEADPRDPFRVLAETSAVAAKSFRVNSERVFDLADEIVIETLVEEHFDSVIRIPGSQTLNAG